MQSCGIHQVGDNLKINKCVEAKINTIKCNTLVCSPVDKHITWLW